MKMRRSISQYLENVVCPEEAEWKTEFDRLKKNKFDGQVMRGMELLARCIEWDDEKLKALQDEQSTLNEEIEKKKPAFGKNKKSDRRDKKRKSRKEKEWETLLPKEEEKKKRSEQAEKEAEIVSSWKSRSEEKCVWN